jgi:hypothetical protein
MPYKDESKKKSWQQRHNVRRREKRATEIRAREARLGHNTQASLNWPKRKLRKYEATWIAACIDCDGCLSLGSYWNHQRNSYNFHVNASLQMTDPSIPNKLLELCGGNIFFNERVVIKHKSIWAWHIGANGVRWLLPQIMEHLLIKKRQAELILEFLTISKRGVASRAEYNPRAQEIRAEVKKLNQRGIQTSPEGHNSEPA